MEEFYKEVAEDLRLYREEVSDITQVYLHKLCESINKKVPFNQMFVGSIFDGEYVYSNLSFGANQNIWLEGEWEVYYNKFMQLKSHDVLGEDVRRELAIEFENIMFNTYGTDWVILVDNLDDGFKIEIHHLENDNLL